MFLTITVNGNCKCWNPSPSIQGDATDHKGRRAGRPAARGRHGQAQLVGRRHPDGLATGMHTSIIAV